MCVHVQGVQFLVLSTQERTGQAGLLGPLFLKEISSKHENQTEAALA